MQRNIKLKLVIISLAFAVIPFAHQHILLLTKKKSSNTSNFCGRFVEPGKNYTTCAKVFQWGEYILCSRSRSALFWNFLFIKFSIYNDRFLSEVSDGYKIRDGVACYHLCYWEEGNQTLCENTNLLGVHTKNNVTYQLCHIPAHYYKQCI